MSKPDLDTVLARRTQIKGELDALEQMRVDMEAEDQDLLVAERVLKRLASLPIADTSAPSSSQETPPIGNAYAG